MGAILKQRVFDPIATPHRKLVRRDSRPQRGRDVRGLQQHLNVFIDAHPHLGVSKLKVDGEANRQTVTVGRLVAGLMGVYPGESGVSVTAQRLVRSPGKRTQDQLKHADVAQEERRALLKRQAEAKRKPTITLSPDRVTGGTFEQKVSAALFAAQARCKAHPGDYFYAQGGAADWDHAISVPARGHRYDCSSFGAGIARSCGQDWLVDGGFFTGTAKTIGVRCSLAELRPGGFVVFGKGVGHHMEMYYGDGVHSYAETLKRHGQATARITVGHGSTPVDFGDLFMFGDATYYNAPSA